MSDSPPVFDAAFWDDRYRDTGSVWGVAPNRWVEQEVGSLPPGNALDLACGEGRNALWLASRGWRVDAVDFSGVAVEKGRAAAERDGLSIAWHVADVLDYHGTTDADLVLLSYLQLPADQRRQAVRHAAAALGSGGTLLVVAHDSSNITHGTGGPQNPAVLYTADDLLADLAGTELVVEKATVLERPVTGVDRPALDCLLRARRPG